MGDDDGQENQSFLMSTIRHYQSPSFLRNLLTGQELKLYSNGDLKFSGEKSLGSISKLNIHDSTEPPKYREGSYSSVMNEALFKVGSLLSYLASISAGMILLMQTDPGEYSNTMFLSGLVLLAFALSFDLLLPAFGTQEILLIQTDRNLSIKGKMKKQSIHNAGMMVLTFLMILVLFAYMSTHSDIGGEGFEIVMGWALFLLILLVMGVFVFHILMVVKRFIIESSSSGEEQNGFDSLSHMYRSMMLLVDDRTSSSSISEQIENLKQKNEELELLRNRLEEYPKISDINSHIDELRQTNSATIGAMIVRAATESLLKKACENEKITLHANGKHTIYNLKQKYIAATTGGLDPTIDSYLELIRNTGNNANHNFNIPWNDFIFMLRKFCLVIEWYSDNYTASPVEVE